MFVLPVRWALRRNLWQIRTWESRASVNALWPPLEGWQQVPAEDLPGVCFLKNCLHSTKRMWEGESREMLFWAYSLRLMHLPIRLGSSLMPFCRHLYSARTSVAEGVRLTPVPACTHTAASKTSYPGVVGDISYSLCCTFSSPSSGILPEWQDSLPHHHQDLPKSWKKEWRPTPLQQLLVPLLNATVFRSNYDQLPFSLTDGNEMCFWESRKKCCIGSGSWSSW